jgi:hypothetical protein
MSRRFFAVLAGIPLALFLFCVFPARADAVDDRFTLMDRNQDGLLDWDEFSAINPHILRRGFDSIDTDGSGAISRAEWRIFSDSHGMDISLPGDSAVLPARDPVPPRVATPASPAVSPPLVMPPALPGAPSSPASPRKPDVSSGAGPVPPNGARPPLSPPVPDDAAPAPQSPRSPVLPLITPPAGS